MVDVADYEVMKERIRRDIAQLMHDRKEIDRAIKSRRKLLAHFDTCIQPSRNGHSAPAQEAGQKAAISLTQAVRGVVYTEAGKPILPTDVRTRLVESHIRPASANLLSQVHAVLRRLARRGEVAKARIRKRKAYKMPKGIRNP